MEPGPRKTTCLDQFAHLLLFYIPYDMQPAARLLGDLGRSRVESSYSLDPNRTRLAIVSWLAFAMTEMTAELSLFSAVGFLLIAIDDLAVDMIYFLRRGWRQAVIYSRFPKMSADRLPAPMRPGLIAVLI